MAQSVSPLVYTETNNQPDRPMAAGVDASKNTRDGIGLNMSGTLLTDCVLPSTTTTQRPRESPIAFTASANISMAAFGRNSASVNYDSEIPVTTIGMEDPLSDDMQITGSVFNELG